MQYVIIIALLAVAAFLFLKKGGTLPSIPGVEGGYAPEGEGAGGDDYLPERRRAYQTAAAPLLAWLRAVKNQYGTLVSENLRTCGAHAHNVSYPQLVDRCNNLLAWYNSPDGWLAPSDFDVIVNTWDVIRAGAWDPHLRGLKDHGRDCAEPTEVHIGAVQMKFNSLVGLPDILIDFYTRYDVNPNPIWGPDNQPTFNF